jgi:hypothetical protein
MVVKNLKVINSEELVKDGNFEIGLRDALLINKNSKVSLDKFVYKQKSKNTVGFVVSDTKPYKIKFNPDTRGGGDISKPALTREFNLANGTYKTAQDLVLQINKQLCNQLQTGSADTKNPKDTLLNYFEQKPSNPTNDAGLDIASYVDRETNNVHIQFDSYELSKVIDDDEGNIHNITMYEDQGFTDLFSPNDQGGLGWWVAGGYPVVKGGLQLYLQINGVGNNPANYEVGFRRFNNTAYGDTNFDGVDCGLMFYPQTRTYLLQLGTGGLPTDTGVGYADNDQIFMYTYKGLLYIQIADANDKFKYCSPGLDNLKIGDDTEKFRAYIGTGKYPPGIGNDPPFFSEFKVTNTNIETRNLSRKIELDFSETSLANELGFPSSVLSSRYSPSVGFIGVSSPSFFSLQDISIYWSLPMQSFIASADKKRNAREKLVASFTPVRSVDRYDTLSYNSALPFVTIGNDQQMNISSLSFRVINEYTGKAIDSSYLSFNLVIKDENDA